MDALTISAASGLRARMESLEMLANNMANASTGGYKTDREFYSLYVSPEAQAAGAEGLGPTTAPVIESHWTDYSQGVLVPTGNKLDLALTGQGFFTANSPSGPLFTRNGSFRLSSDGVLVTGEGYPLEGVGKVKIQAQSGSPLEFTPEGEVLQEGQSLGRLALATFPAATSVVKQGNNYFRMTDPNSKPQPATDAQVEQGKIESSNVSSAEAAVRLVSVMRQFEMLQKAVTMGMDMNRAAVEQVARVGS